MQPIVSVIMANYNSSQYIAEAIYSVLTQTMHDVELIIIDDASTDTSPQIIQAIAEKDLRIIFVRSEKNGGPAAARNRALELTRGQWISIMDSDDVMHPRRLEQLVSFAEDDNADVVADNLMMFWQDRSLVPEVQIDLSQAIWVDAVDLMTNANKYGYLKPVFRSAKFGNIRYNERLIVCEDIDYLLRKLMSGCRLRIYPLATYFYRKHEMSISRVAQRNYVEAVLEADKTFRKEFSPKDRLLDACDKRKNELENTINYLDLIDSIRKKMYFRFFWLAVRHPAALYLMKVPLKVRINRLLKYLKIVQLPEKRNSTDQVAIDQILLDVRAFGDNLL